MLQGTQHGLETEFRIGREALWRRQIKAILFDIIKTILSIHSSVNCAQNMSKQFNPIGFMTSFTFLKKNKRPQTIKPHIQLNTTCLQCRINITFNSTSG